MRYTYTNLKNDVVAMLHGTTLDQISNFEGLVQRSVAELLLEVDLKETKRTTQITTPIFNSIYDYACPIDLKGNKVIDIFPQVNRYSTNVLGQTYNREFDRTKGLGLNNFTIIDNMGVGKSIRISYNNSLQGITLSDCSSINSNGLWSTTGENLREDNVYFVSNSSSLSFDLTDTGQSILNTTLKSLDLTNHENQSTIFLWVYMPIALNFESIELRWGSDINNYWFKINTIANNDIAFQNGWNLIPFNWSGSSLIGNPDITKINYLEVIFNTNGESMTGVKIDNIISQLGSIMLMEYYSKYLFMNGLTGALLEKPLSTINPNDIIINLDTDSYHLLTYKVAMNCFQQQAGANSGLDYQMIDNLYRKGIQQYKSQYKSEIIPITTQYYKKRRNGYSQFYKQS